MTRTKKSPVATLEQLAFRSSQPHTTQVPMDVLRNVLKKTTRVKKQDLDKTKKKLTSPKSPTGSLMLLQEIRRNLSIYLAEQKNVPLDILVNMHSVFEQQLLTSERLSNFEHSPKKMLVFDMHLYGNDNITLLLKFARKTYLVILEGRYTDFIDCLTQQQLQQDDDDEDLSELTKCVSATFARVPKAKAKVMFAVPISRSRPGTPPLPFQKKTPNVLSAIIREESR